MRKELLIAIISGLLIGLLVAFGAWRFRSFYNNNQRNEVSDQKTPQNQARSEDVNNKQANTDITLSKPEDLDVIIESPVKISGISKPGNMVIISSENEDIILETSDGVFNTETDLLGGINQIFITSWDKADSQVKKTLLVVYSSEFSKYLQSETSEENTATSGSVLDKVKQKVDSLRKNPKVIIGSITDKTGDTLQIQNLEGKIELAGISEDVTYARLGKTQIDAEFSDVAIGDFVAALGFSTGNGVLEAKRILMTDPPQDDERNATFAEILSTKAKILTLKSPDGTEFSVTFPRTWAGPEIKELEEGQKVAVIYEKDSDNEQFVRTIQIVQTNDSSTAASQAE